MIRRDAAGPDAPFRLRATDVLPQTADLVVVGAGVVGCATAFRAARAGLRTVVLDARPRPATLTTPAATGAYRLQFDNAEEVALVREGIELYEDFAAATGLPGYEMGLRRRATCSALATSERGRAAAGARRAAARVWPGSTWSCSTATRSGVASRGSPKRSSRLDSAPATASSTRFGWHGATRSRPRRGRVWIGRRAPARRPSPSASASSSLRVVGGRIVAVETHDGAVAAPLVVIATGPFVGRTAALAGVDVPIAPTRRQKVVVPDAPEVPGDAPMTIDETTGAHWRPALRGAYILLTEPATPPTEPGLERPDVAPITRSDSWTRRRRTASLRLRRSGPTSGSAG